MKDVLIYLMSDSGFRSSSQSESQPHNLLVTSLSSRRTIVPVPSFFNPNEALTSVTEVDSLYHCAILDTVQCVRKPMWSGG
jgi:hypothetical protein